jgi:hypothetical protein
MRKQMLNYLKKLGSITARWLEYLGTPVGDGYSVYVGWSGSVAIVEYAREEPSEKPGGGFLADYNLEVAMVI